MLKVQVVQFYYNSSPLCVAGLQDRFPQDQSGPAAAAPGPVVEEPESGQTSGPQLGQGRGRGSRGPKTPPSAPLRHGQRLHLLRILLQVVPLPQLQEAQVTEVLLSVQF